MTKGILNYERMVERALRSVVIHTLEEVVEFGLPGSHQIYITFSTNVPGVNIPDHLRKKYREEMTIVLQHQFWDLSLEDDRFMVTLSFNNQKECLAIPFEAIKSFADPSVNFGLQLKFEGHTDGRTPIALDETSQKSEPVSGTQATVKKKDTNIVTLDTFRKK